MAEIQQFRRTQFDNIGQVYGLINVSFKSREEGLSVGLQSDSPRSVENSQVR